MDFLFIPHTLIISEAMRLGCIGREITVVPDYTRSRHLLGHQNYINFNISYKHISSDRVCVFTVNTDLSETEPNNCDTLRFSVVS
jgi:hypothetical protein